MTSLMSPAVWFLKTSGSTILIGLLLAFLLSPFSRLAPEARSRIAIFLSFFIALLQIATPALSSPGPHDDLPSAVASAFGFAFALDRLRGERGRSPGDWLLTLWHARRLAGFVRDCLRALNAGTG